MTPTEIHIDALMEKIEELQAENALLKEQVKFGVDCFNALNEANARYREALEFYADDESGTDDCSIAREALKGE